MRVSACGDTAQCRARASSDCIFSEILGTYAAQDGGDRLEGVLWVGSDPATTKAVAVQLTGPDLPADVVDQVQDSIAVLDTDATPGT